MQDKNKLNIAGKIEVKDVERPLYAKGWEPLDAWDDIMIYRRPQVENVFNEIVLPKSQNDELYASYLLSAAEAFAEYEKLSVDDVLALWSRLRFDCAKFRLVSDKVKNGTAPLYCVQSLVSGALATLKAAIKDVETPSRSRRFHARVDSSSINELMKRAEFGQPQVGSYIINVLVPYGAQNEESSFEETYEHVYRRGIEHLIRTLDSAVRFATSDTPNAFLEAEENKVVSPNLLESVLEARGEDEAELEVSIDWSPILPPSPGTPNRVSINEESARVMNAWAQTWKPRKMEETKKFVGKVIKFLECERDEDSKPFGGVVFSIFDDEKNYATEASLDVDDYKIAYDAFYEDAAISFEGRVIKQNRKTTILDVQNVRAV